MTFAAIVTLVQVLFFAGIFLLFISGSAGWTLVFAFLLAVVISIITTLISHRRYTVEAEEFSGLVNVGEECTIRINVRKNGFCLIPYLTLHGSFSGKSFAIKLSLLTKSSVTAEVTLKPDSCGLNKAVITHAYTEDFLWILKLKRKQDVRSDVAVLPRKVEYTGPEVTPSLLPSQSERREDGMTVPFGGTPGYEHREYINGDSPRRINYKLSAKKQTLMVRLDESNGTESTNILLPQGADGSCFEQALALAEKLAMKNAPSAIFHGSDSFEAESPSSLSKLREWLAFRDPDSIIETKRPEGTVCVEITTDGAQVHN